MAVALEEAGVVAKAAEGEETVLTGTVARGVEVDMWLVGGVARHNGGPPRGAWHAAG